MKGLTSRTGGSDSTHLSGEHRVGSERGTSQAPVQSGQTVGPTSLRLRTAPPPAPAGPTTSPRALGGAAVRSAREGGVTVPVPPAASKGPVRIHEREWTPETTGMTTYLVLFSPNFVVASFPVALECSVSLISLPRLSVWFRTCPSSPARFCTVGASASGLAEPLGTRGIAGANVCPVTIS